MIEYLKLGAEALILTIAVEILIALLLGLRRKTELTAVLLINLITNPALNFLLALNNQYRLIHQTTILTLCLEVLVVFIEWKLLVYALRLNNKKAFVLSLSMNAASFLAGLIIFSYFL
jgi:hypothetical protein